MEPSDLEKQLGDLEEKVDRLRSLYEQYFMGIERIEPITPRKEVDRRIYQLRKEQMRNTALRFRFNTICQRFNTMQQHWGRITREIENGTYKRDVARAAARFGVDEALTAVGRKRAKAFAKVLEAQRAAGQPEGPRAEAARGGRKPSDEYEAVSEADLVSDEDDAPTPPPLRPLPPPVTYDASRFAPPPVDPAAVEPMRSDLAAEPPGPSGARAVAEGPGEGPKKSAAGLRLGGGAPRRADPDAARKRLAELAQQMGAGGASPAPPPTASRPRFDPADVVAAAVPPSAPPPASPARPAAAPSSPSRPSPVAAGQAPELPQAPPPSSPAGRPLGLRPPSARASSPSLEPEADAARARPPAATEAPSAAARAEAKRDAVADRAARREDLGEPRVREIYKEFVEAKRRANESTAGVTFDKLADSLRKQADKLKKEHAGRSVDFAVVTKDGKTLIKPIIK